MEKLHDFWIWRRLRLGDSRVLENPSILFALLLEPTFSWRTSKYWESCTSREREREREREMMQSLLICLLSEVLSTQQSHFMILPIPACKIILGPWNRMATAFTSLYRYNQGPRRRVWAPVDKKKYSDRPFLPCFDSRLYHWNFSLT